MSFALFLTMAMGVMLSPDGLILLGNSMGHVGVAFLGWMGLAAVAMLCTAQSYAMVQTFFPGPGGEARCLRAAFGTVPAIVLPLCARLVFTVCASTGMLAIAGYVFNEVFVYWFPNLGFSFYLLGFLLLLNLSSPRLAEWAQIVLVTVAVVGLLTFVGLGLAAPGAGAVVETSAPVTAPPMVYSAALSLWLFLGCELAILIARDNDTRADVLRKCMVLGIGLVGLTFCAWGLVSIHYVPRTRLADISVPHMLTARALLGDPGRLLMGMVVLAGTSSAVNALLIAGARMLVGMAQEGFLPSCLAWNARRAPVPLLLLAFGPAAMMYMGMAGEPETEVFARGGIVFWWLLYLTVHLAVLRGWQQRQKRQGQQSGGWLPPVLGSLLLGSSILGLLWTDHERAHLLTFMCYVAASVLLYSVGWMGWQRYRGKTVAVVVEAP